MKLKEVLSLYPELPLKPSDFTNNKNCSDRSILVSGPGTSFNDRLRSNRNLRTNFLNDQIMIERYVGHLSNPFFGGYDCLLDNLINMPLGFIPCEFISANSKYYNEINFDEQYYRKLFWSGSKNHDSRLPIVDYFKSRNSSEMEVDYWALPRGISPYTDKRPDSSEYKNFINKMLKSDMFLVMRGDVPWTFTFMDCLMTGTIPICINTFYNRIGWQHIGYQPDDLFMSFDTRETDVEEIYEKCLDLLHDEHRVKYMKDNIKSFYHKFIINDRLLTVGGTSNYWVNHLIGWTDFWAAKLLEYVQNGYKLVNNQFICPHINVIKRGGSC